MLLVDPLALSDVVLSVDAVESDDVLLVVSEALMSPVQEVSLFVVASLVSLLESDAVSAVVESLVALVESDVLSLVVADKEASRS